MSTLAHDSGQRPFGSRWEFGRVRYGWTFNLAEQVRLDCPFTYLGAAQWARPAHKHREFRAAWALTVGGRIILWGSHEGKYMMLVYRLDGLALRAFDLFAPGEDLGGQVLAAV